MNRTSAEASRDELLVVVVGLGAVTSTLAAGVASARARELRVPPATTLPEHLFGTKLAGLESLSFAAFDVAPTTAFDAAMQAGVLSVEDVQRVEAPLQAIRARVGVTRETIRDEGGGAAIRAIRSALRDMLRDAGAARAVMLIALPTEFATDATSAADLERIAAGEFDDTRPSVTLAYTVAAILEQVPVANLTPNRSTELEVVQQLAFRHGVPITGNDLKTGQTFLKTVIAPALRDRGLTINGWYSTNILGNRDGENLRDHRAAATKISSKEDCLAKILADEQTDPPWHTVRIDYYPPRGDNKESWDCIDFSGWLGYPMSLRINFLCRDSILAAPLALDLALLLDAAHRSGLVGPQPWLGGFFKSPVATAQSPPPVHSFPRQLEILSRGCDRLRPGPGRPGLPRRAIQAFRESFCEVRESLLHQGGPLAVPDDVVETALIQKISARLPGIGFLGEETGRRRGSRKATVLIDPIDGTSNARRGLPGSAVCLTLLDDDTPSLNAARAVLVGHIATGRCHVAIRGQGAEPSFDTNGSDGAVACDLDGPVDLEVLRQLMDRYPLLRRIGATTMELALLASGALDAFIDFRGLLTPENFVGPALLVKEAGRAFEVLGVAEADALDMNTGYRVVAARNRTELQALLELVKA